MRYKIEIREDQNEDIVVYAKSRTDTLRKIEALLEIQQGELFGYDGGETVRLSGDEVYAFMVEAGRIYALTKDKKWQVRERLYRLEQQYANAFVKINQSCMINLSKIKKFQTSIGGSLSVILENGYQDYISRRQLKSVKERMNF